MGKGVGDKRFLFFTDHFYSCRQSLDCIKDRALRDYSGDTVPILQVDTGEVREALIFVAVLGGSDVYAEAT